ncbi:MAG: aspartate carbamoyltransferase [Euryarchaeota archaeon]|nr:aspartate carbamoyltransferase [Euryarchaeota archaeon]
MFRKRHLISIRDFTREEMEAVLRRAEELERHARPDLMRGRILANLFFEPSTRTRLSFETAMKRLGGEVLNLDSEEASSMAKGETLSDTVRVIGGYADAIVLRHSREGAARMAAEVSGVPVINAGDGAGQHPTQTLLDLYTIRRESHLEGLRIAMVGDLKYGRTVHSLAYALALYGARIYPVAPEGLALPADLQEDLRHSGARLQPVKSLQEALRKADVLYVTRIQKERFPDPQEYRRVAGSYRITLDLLRRAPKGLVILHPLPRVDEIDPRVDGTPYARYFRQAYYGVPVRMAVLSLLLPRRGKGEA